VESANEGVRAMTAELAQRGNFDLVETAFLELAQPDLPAAVASLCAQGATRIVVVPFFLTLGIHLRRDLPGIVDELRGIHQGVEFDITPPLEGHPALVDVMLGRAQGALTRPNAGETD
jgi:sirohydrochlorin ferrochelatase